MSEHAEHSYFNKSHPSKIPFMTLIKICNHMRINFENIIKNPEDRTSNPNIHRNGKSKWTEEVIKEFIMDYESKDMILENISEKYEISINTVMRFYKNFKKGRDCNGKERE